jgi:hypothetical protein
VALQGQSTPSGPPSLAGEERRYSEATPARCPDQAVEAKLGLDPVVQPEQGKQVRLPSAQSYPIALRLAIWYTVNRQTRRHAVKVLPPTAPSRRKEPCVLLRRLP